MSDIKKNKKNKLLLIIICSVILVGVIVVCVIFGISKDNNDTNPQTNTAPYEEVLEDCFDIETPYATLKYPSKWKNDVEIKHINEDIYTVEFYKADKNEPIHLFDIAFGGEEGDFIGALVTEEGTTDVMIISYNIDDDIPADELEVIDNMLEDVNQLILALNENKDFKGL